MTDPSLLTLEEEGRIIGSISSRLTAKSLTAQCPFCGHKTFSLIKGYTHRNLSRSKKNMVFGGTIIPCASILCNYCGLILDFSLGVLDLLEDKPGVKEDVFSVREVEGVKDGK